MLRGLRHLLEHVLCGRRSISAGLAVVYFITASGIPLPSGIQPKTGEDYPCAHHACGCDSAEQCWCSCCCFTLAQRFEWARAHQVRPPQFAIAAARDSGMDLAWLGIAKTQQSRCAAKASCCAHAHESPVSCQAEGTCCHAIASSDCCTAHDRATPIKKTHRVVGWMALGCHGHSLDWLAAVPSLISVESGLTNEVTPITWLGPARSESVRPLSDLPDVPPPERA
jgi:hypothetical protein